MTYEIETKPNTWYTYNATRACTITELIDGEKATLSTLSTGGTGSFFASGSHVIVNTDGKFIVRPFNAPQGAKLPEWLNSHENDFLAWGKTLDGGFAPVAGRLNKQIVGISQFDVNGLYEHKKNIGAQISAALINSTFEEQTHGDNQFQGVSGGISLPFATFAKEVSAGQQFRNVKDGINLPRASFRNCSSFYKFAQNASGVIMLNALNPKAVYNSTDAFYGDAIQEIHAYSYECKEVNIGGFVSIFDTSNEAAVYAPSFLGSGPTNLSYLFRNGASFYAPRLNMRRAEVANSVWVANHGCPLDMLRQIVYGPKVVPDGDGGWKMPETVYTDDDGIVQMIAPADVQGERILSNGSKKTDFGIQDFRVTDGTTGEFVLDADGHYTYPWGGEASPHVLSIVLPQAAQGDAEYEVCENELVARGWQFVILKYV